MKNVTLLILGVLTLVGTLKAQKTSYLFNPLEYNPAFTGSQDNLNVNLSGGMQWVGLDGVPRFIGLSVQSPINENLGVGFNVKESSIGPTRTRSAFGSLSYSLQASPSSKLSLGMNFGVDVYSANFSSLIVSPALASAGVVSQVLPNVGIGAYWFDDKSFIGLSTDKLIRNEFNSKLSYNSVPVKQNRSYFLLAGYTFVVNKEIQLKPSFIIEIMADAPLSVRGDLNFIFYERFQIGSGYKNGQNGESVIANVVYNFNPKFRMGYAYEYEINRLGYSSGMHQMVLGYNANLNSKHNIFKTL